MDTQNKLINSNAQGSRVDQTLSMYRDDTRVKSSSNVDISPKSEFFRVKASERSDNAECVETPKELSDRYKFIRQIGHGSQGDIFEAIRLADQLPVAIKALQINSLSAWKTYDLFKREANALQSLQIKGVAKFYEAPEYLQGERPAAYIVQEFIDGRSLADLMRSGYRFASSRIFAIMVRLLGILKQLHQNDPAIVHRDIKPSNILYCSKDGEEDFDIYIIDFGAVSNPRIQTGGSTVAGTFGYMPPEQLMGKPCPASDIYSLAATCAYLLSGVEPSDMEVRDFKLQIEPHLNNFSAQIVAILGQMLSPIVEHRLVDYDVLIQAFNQFSELSKYQNQNSLYHQLSEEEINEKLQNVLGYTSSGNMDLWCSLSDQVPRKIPQAYIQTNKFESLDISSFNDRLKKMRSGYIPDCIKTLAFAVGWVAFFGWFIVLEICGGKIWVGNIAFILIGFIFCLFGFVIGWLCINNMIQFYRLYNDPEFNNKKQYKKDLLSYIDQNKSSALRFEKLLVDGRKSMATVVAVEHAPTPDCFIESYRKTQMEFNKGSGKTKDSYDIKPTDKFLYYCHSKPRQIIRYKFNPPDDASLDDLVHEVTTFTNSMEGLHPGMTIPILYHINPENKADVTSVPFPVPYVDLVDYNNLIGFNS